ncbi:MAG: hypothetical protein ABI977_26545 [Acidobacteriota bacterium]
MFLTEPQVEQALSQVRVAFPNLVNWEYSNDIEEDYFGFTVWGCLVIQDDTDSLLQRRFYATFDLYENKWRGTLTVGQHSYLWTSADAGDAHLAATESCASLPEAIAALKVEIARLANAFSAV